MTIKYFGRTVCKKNNMASSGYVKIIYLPIFIHTTDGIIDYVMTETWCQMVWHQIANAVPDICTMLVMCWNKLWVPCTISHLAGFGPCVVGTWCYQMVSLSWRSGVLSKTSSHMRGTSGIFQCSSSGMDHWSWYTWPPWWSLWCCETHYPEWRNCPPQHNDLWCWHDDKLGKETWDIP